MKAKNDERAEYSCVILTTVLRFCNRRSDEQRHGPLFLSLKVFSRKKQMHASSWNQYVLYFIFPRKLLSLHWRAQRTLIIYSPPKVGGMIYFIGRSTQMPTLTRSRTYAHIHIHTHTLNHHRDYLQRGEWDEDVRRTTSENTYLVFAGICIKRTGSTGIPPTGKRTVIVRLVAT